VGLAVRGGWRAAGALPVARKSGHVAVHMSACHADLAPRTARSGPEGLCRIVLLPSGLAQLLLASPPKPSLAYQRRGSERAKSVTSLPRRNRRQNLHMVNG